MKRIEAFVQHHRLSGIVTALHALPNFPGFTVLNSHGQGHGRGEGGHYVYEPDEGLLYHKGCVLLVLCDDKDADRIARTIIQAAHTGNKGDGIVVVSHVARVLRIGTAGGDPA
jgi:nitrogen regulatory protein PII